MNGWMDEQMGTENMFYSYISLKCKKVLQHFRAQCDYMNVSWTLKEQFRIGLAEMGSVGDQIQTRLSMWQKQLKR